METSRPKCARVRPLAEPDEPAHFRLVRVIYVHPPGTPDADLEHGSSDGPSARIHLRSAGDEEVEGLGMPAEKQKGSSRFTHMLEFASPAWSCSGKGARVREGREAVGEFCDVKLLVVCHSSVGDG